MRAFEWYCVSASLAPQATAKAVRRRDSEDGADSARAHQDPPVLGLCGLRPAQAAPIRRASPESMLLMFGRPTDCPSNKVQESFRPTAMLAIAS